jgi:hypothetical protein
VLRLLSASSRRLIATGMLGEDSRLAVNGLIGTSDSLALYVAGLALGGLVAALTSPELVLLINGISYVGLLIAGALAVPSTRPRGQEETVKPAETASGWAILQHTPVALRLFLVVFLFDLFYGPVEVALPLLVTDALGADSRVLGVLWTSFGLGALCGALLTNQLRRLPQRMLLVGIIGGWATSVGLLAATPTVTVAGAALAVGGVVCGRWSLIGPSAAPGCPAVTRSDKCESGAGRGSKPHRDDGVPVHVHPCRHRVTMVGAAGCAMMVNASSPSSVSTCTAWRTMRRAWDRVARLAS